MDILLKLNQTKVLRVPSSIGHCIDGGSFEITFTVPLNKSVTKQNDLLSLAQSYEMSHNCYAEYITTHL